jgi:hypothetical protein
MTKVELPELEDISQTLVAQVCEEKKASGSLNSSSQANQNLF